MKERLKVLSVMLMVLSLSLTVVSCSDDDDDKVNNSIVGTWKYESVAAGEITTNSTVNDEKTAEVIVAWGENDFGSFIYTFTADGAFTLIDSEGTDSGTYTFENGILHLVWRGNPDDSDTYTVSIENGVFYLYEDYTEDCNDLELDKLSELGISDPTDFTVTKAIAKLSFNRQQ